jgi:hypothetical protein
MPRADGAHRAAYGSALRGHALRLQRCGTCGFVRHPPGPICPECWSGAFDWQEHAGEGEVKSFVWYMESLDPRFPDVPYNVALVRLAQGPVIVSSVVDIAVGALQVGDRVVASFTDEPGGHTVLQFRKLAS